MGFSEEWIRTYRQEIDWTMQMADRMFGRLVRFADRNPEYQVWVATSMGQAATTAKAIETQLYIQDLGKLMAALGFTPEEWSQRPAMLPQTNLLVSPGLSGRMHAALNSLRVAGEPVRFRERESGFFSIDMGQTNIDEAAHRVTLGGQAYGFADLGMVNVEIEDKSGSSAYHIPEGCLFVYDPLDRSVKRERPEIATTEIAPSILRNFGAAVPDYMPRPATLVA
jgi:hypothetical protein